jgi:cell division protein FtsZ
MSLNLGLAETSELEPKICIFGVGGAGGNAVKNMMTGKLEGVEFLVLNTDAQALLNAPEGARRIQLGLGSTKGLGAGSHPEVGRIAAEESLPEIIEALEGCHMVFITTGMGGGTGTGASPVIAKAAKERGILTVGVITKPFHFEGSKRMNVAELGLHEMLKYVDTLIVIPNQNLFRVANDKTTFADAFSIADKVLHYAVRGVTDLITTSGIINLDFADIRTIMVGDGNRAMMGTGEAEGEDRARKAAEAAMSNPLLDTTSMKGAKGVIINITGGVDMTLYEVDAAANMIRKVIEESNPHQTSECQIIFGAAFDEALEGKIRVSVVAAGIDSEGSARHNISFAQNAVNDEKAMMGDATKQPAEDDMMEVANETANEGDEGGEESFIPPKPYEPDESRVCTEEEKQDEFTHNIPPVATKHPTSLFGKMAAGLNLMGDQGNKSASQFSAPPKPAEPSRSDIFEIPAFLRRRRKSQ